jgi:hypothetical protein
VKTMKNVKYTNRTWVMATKQKNVEKETQTLFQLEYCEKTEKRGRIEPHMVGLAIWRETLKNLQNEKLTL